MISTHTFEGIIKQLLRGWVPNHSRDGELVREWWHPARDVKVPMRYDEFAVMKIIEAELDREVIQQIKEESDG